MPKDPTAREARQSYREDWILFLTRRDALENIMALDAGSFTEPAQSLASLQAAAARIWNEGEKVTLERLGELLSQARVAGCPTEVQKAAEHFFACKKAAAPPRVRHEVKRKIAASLGFFKEPYYLRDLLSGERPSDTIPDFTLKEKKRNLNHCVPQRCYLSEVVDGGAVVTNAETGYDVIDLDQSVIYFSRGDDGKIIIELVVLRNVAGNALFADVLYKWIYQVILNACAKRTNIRPNDAGTMTQLGLNMGAHHLRAIALADSFKKLKSINKDTKQSDDQDAVGVISLAWGILEKVMPQEVIDISYQQLTKFGMPELETRNLPSGGGYTVKISDREVTFPTARRAPPEGYLSKGYEARSHTDKAYSPYAFTFNVDRRIVPKEETPEPSRQTRGATKKKVEGSKPDAQGPPGGGGSFVDISLGVVVRQGPGTMMAIRPEFMHGTSMGYGAENSGITISFSERLIEAWEIARKSGVTIEDFQDID